MKARGGGPIEYFPFCLLRRSDGRAYADAQSRSKRYTISRGAAAVCTENSIRHILANDGAAAAWPLAVSTSHFERFSEPKFGAIDRPVRATVAMVTCPAYFWSQVARGK
jgi:hypothetical protein